MRRETEIRAIAKVIHETLAADFDEVSIVDVKVSDEVDFDGDNVLRVDVIFEGTRKDVDAKKLSRAVRQVRPKLSEIGEHAFPLFSFISRGDTGATRLEPA